MCVDRSKVGKADGLQIIAQNERTLRILNVVYPEALKLLFFVIYLVTYSMYTLSKKITWLRVYINVKEMYKQN